MKNTPTLLYFFDPLCGWCYASYVQLQEFMKLYPDVTVRLLCGCMVMGENVGTYTDQVRTYVRQELAKIEQVQAAKFPNIFYSNIVDNKDYIHSSELPTRVIHAYRAVKQESENSISINESDVLAFAHRVQALRFIEGKDISTIEVYDQLFAEYNLDQSVMRELSVSSNISTTLYREMIQCSEYDIHSFPAYLWYKNGETMKTFEGYKTTLELGQECGLYV